jgi:hypothetical protein
MSNTEAVSFLTSQLASTMTDMEQYGDIDSAMRTILMVSTLASSMISSSGMRRRGGEEGREGRREETTNG